MGVSEVWVAESLICWESWFFYCEPCLIWRRSLLEITARVVFLQQPHSGEGYVSPALAVFTPGFSLAFLWAIPGVTQ